MEQSTGQKRSFADAELQSVEDQQDGTVSAMMTPGTVLPGTSMDSCVPPVPVESRETSPLSSIMSSLTRDNSASPAVQPSESTAIQQPPPRKKRKLTLAEKEVLRIEKQHKELQKAEERARKEEEKGAREEERRVKEQEREEKRRLRDAEKQARDEDRQKRDMERKAKEEEKARKEKSQLRLNSFFTKPAPPQDGAPQADHSGVSSRRSSIASVEGAGSLCFASAPLDQPQQSHFDQAFPSFFVHAHTRIAPLNRFIPKQEGPEYLGHQIDDALVAYQNLESLGRNGPQPSTCEVLQGTASKYRKFTPTITSVKDIISQINESATQSTDLNRSNTITPSNLIELLKTVPVKYLRFAEDVRPPYVGTYSKAPFGKFVRKLPRKPFTRALPATNYDHDSEAEWEEPGEGEDLDSEGEEEIGDEDEGDDMGEFLEDDDADKSGMKRRNVMGDVEPISTILHWEGSAKWNGPRLVPYGESSLDLKAFRLEILLADSPWPLDPYSTSYWHNAGKNTTESHATSMAPPSRIPLNTIQQSCNIPSINYAASSSKSHAQPQGLTSKKSVLSKPIPPELLDEFKKAINGSDLTKAGLVEVLKKKFPQITKGTVHETLALVAERIGKKEADKRWRLLV